MEVDTALRSQPVSMALGGLVYFAITPRAGDSHCDTNRLRSGPSVVAPPEALCELLGIGARPQGRTCPDQSDTWSVRNLAFPLRALFGALSRVGWYGRTPGGRNAIYLWGLVRHTGCPKLRMHTLNKYGGRAY